MSIMDNMEIWNKVKTPPPSALKQIKGGRLSGMTDISPQWRYEVLTETLGPCGINWKYEIIRLWLESGAESQVVAFAEIKFHHRDDGCEWSDAIPGIGGSMFIAKEKNGLHTSDEAFKMAVTDAISTAVKLIGVGADVYMGKWDGSKYKDTPEKPQDAPQSQKKENVGKGEDNSKKEWFKKFIETMKAEKLRIGANLYYDVLNDFNLTHCNEVKTHETAKKIWGVMQGDLIVCPDCLPDDQDRYKSPKYCNVSCAHREECPAWE